MDASAHPLPLPRPTARRWPWPLPALAVWLAAWALLLGLRAVGAAPAVALLAGQSLALLVAWRWRQASVWRRLMVAGGFALSAVGSGMAAGLPPWGWLLPLALLLVLYPLRAWRDAPLFPTPREALAGAAALTALPPGARLLDAGCGLGHGLLALRAEWPQARLCGTEWSWPLRLAAGLRCPWARLRRGDMWADDWSGYALVYLFQRPESMARAWAKAQAEMAPGSWLASLSFPVPALPPTASVQRPGHPPLWLYRVGPR